MSQDNSPHWTCFFFCFFFFYTSQPISINPLFLKVCQSGRNTFPQKTHFWASPHPSTPVSWSHPSSTDEIPASEILPIFELRVPQKVNLTVCSLLCLERVCVRCIVLSYHSKQNNGTFYLWDVKELSGGQYRGVDNRQRRWYLSKEMKEARELATQISGQRKF